MIHLNAASKKYSLLREISYQEISLTSSSLNYIEHVKDTNSHLEKFVSPQVKTNSSLSLCQYLYFLWGSSQRLMAHPRTSDRMPSPRHALTQKSRLTGVVASSHSWATGAEGSAHSLFLSCLGIRSRQTEFDLPVFQALLWVLESQRRRSKFPLLTRIGNPTTEQIKYQVGKVPCSGIILRGKNLRV